VAATPAIHSYWVLIAVARGIRESGSARRARLVLIDAPILNNPVAHVSNLLVSGLWEAAGDDRRAWDAVNRQHMNVGRLGFQPRPSGARR
jgi:hypothetical protein